MRPSLFPLLLAVSVARSASLYEGKADYSAVCQQIASTVSSASAVAYPSSEQYEADIKHWAAAAEEEAACSVEPGTPEDLGTILKIVGQTKTPFAVKSGGHSPNAGFSSTTGVQIALSRFDEITVSDDKSTVAIGAGLKWDSVYEKLSAEGLGAVGARVRGIGVGGFMTGGGYSWHTNQYGLAVDRIKAFELVLPNGTVTTVDDTDTDLWFGLRGGYNNFGIVTKFTLMTHQQSQVWGGFNIIAGLHFDAVSDAVANFAATNTDKKASLIPVYNTLLGLPTIILILFYDGPTPPQSIFEPFTSIPAITSNIKTQLFSDFIQSIPADNSLQGDRRAFFSTTVERISPAIIKMAQNQTLTLGSRVALKDAAPFVTWECQPFDASLYSYGSNSAFPPVRSKPFVPVNLYFSWTLASRDDEIKQLMKELVEDFRNVAIADGQDITGAFRYGSYALPDTSLEDIWGDNVSRLRSIRQTIDPDNVMSLAGGFHF